MPLLQKYLEIICRVLPVGAVGAGLLLGSTLPANAVVQPKPSAEARVSERLAAIREAVFVLTGPLEMSRRPDQNFQLTWGNRWSSGRFGRQRRSWGGPGWNNWRNASPRWNNFWRNW
jgi:hypothetical protein